MLKLFVFVALIAVAFGAPAPEAAAEASPEPKPEANPDLFITHTVPVVSQSLIYKSPILPIARPYAFYNVPSPYVYYPNYYI